MDLQTPPLHHQATSSKVNSRVCLQYRIKTHEKFDDNRR